MTVLCEMGSRDSFICWVVEMRRIKRGDVKYDLEYGGYAIVNSLSGTSTLASQIQEAVV